MRINEAIRTVKVFLIDENNAQIGEIATTEALAMAKEQGLDLVEVSPKALPPVCRIMDYGKHLYQQSKQIRVAKAKQKKVETKGVRIGLRTDSHDLEFKKAQSEKFLKQGDKVKIDIVLKGREKAHQELARKNLQDFLASITAPHKVEDPIKRFPGGFNVTIAPAEIKE
ncbi:MAG: translation initiation factor IF-3 [Candidatus Moraniibacteriota bacterium]